MAQIEGQKLLYLLEKSNEICFVDTESTSLSGDYGSLLVVSVRPYKGAGKTFTVSKVGDDKELAENTRDELSKYTCWCSFYGKLHDIPFINSRLLVNNCAPLFKKHHLDLYFVLKSVIKTSRRSQAHYLNFLSTVSQKMSVSANTWNSCLDRNDPAFATMIKRCESDTLGLRDLYKRVRHLIGEVTR